MCSKNESFFHLRITEGIGVADVKGIATSGKVVVPLWGSGCGLPFPRIPINPGIVIPIGSNGDRKPLQFGAGVIDGWIMHELMRSKNIELLNPQFTGKELISDILVDGQNLIDIVSVPVYQPEKKHERRQRLDYDRDRDQPDRVLRDQRYYEPRDQRYEPRDQRYYESTIL